MYCIVDLWCVSLWYNVLNIVCSKVVNVLPMPACRLKKLLSQVQRGVNPREEKTPGPRGRNLPGKDNPPFVLKGSTVPGLASFAQLLTSSVRQRVLSPQSLGLMISTPGTDNGKTQGMMSVRPVEDLDSDRAAIPQRPLR